jgi:hypothetical protein
MKTQLILMLIVVAGCLVNPAPQQGKYTLSYYQSPSSGFVPDTLDRGIGILTFGPTSTSPSAGHNIEISVFPEIGNTEATSIFLFIPDSLGYRYAIGADRNLQPNIIEFGYEICGLPFDTLTSANWARVILGFESDKKVYKGWVRLDSTTIEYHLWKDLLPKHSLYFFRESNFYDTLGGSPSTWEVNFTTRNYIMHPLNSQGSWIYVRVACPSGMCDGPDAPKSDTLIAWIKYLDDSGRPLVWYYTRGC